MSYELTQQIFEEAEELIESNGEGESLLEKLQGIEKLAPGSASVLCRSARLLFRFGILNSKGRFFLLALDKLKLAIEKDPEFFDTHPIWWQLWGNILIQLGKLVNDTSLLENGLEKFEQASKHHKIDAELYWDWGEAWILLGQKSGEITDFQQGLAKFSSACTCEIRSSFFWLDYAHALTVYGRRIGDPSFLDAAMELLRKVISENYSPEQNEPTLIYLIAWRKIALVAKIRYQLSHRIEHFEEADKLFQEAILSSPKNGELWLDWCEHFLYAGWIHRDLKQIEVALDKLAANKVKECDPIHVSYLLGVGLILLGLFLENLKLLKDGNQQIQTALQAVSDYPPLKFAEGLSELGFGLYFSDCEAFAKAASCFESQIEDSGLFDNRYALFQTYMAWGIQLEDPTYVRKGLKAIQRICELRPFSAVHLNEWGVALLRMRHLEKQKEHVQTRVEEAILLFQKAWDLIENEETLYNWGCAYDILGDLTGDEEHYGKAIDLLSKALDKKPSHLYVRYHLGVALSHLGELVGNADCLMQAIEFLDVVAKVETDSENVWCDLGYTLLNLAQMIDDPIHTQESENRRLEAEKALLRAAELGNGDACYHLACLYSLTGLYEPSIHFLHKAAANKALPPLEDLNQDEWLDGVRETSAFQDFLATRGGHG